MPLPAKVRPVNTRETFIKTAATFFGVGFFPVWPGAVGSLAGVGLCLLFEGRLWIIIALLTIVGYAICRSSIRVFNHADPHPFVLDEVCGMMIGLWTIPREALFVTLGYFLFRFLDTVKPWPISRFQQSKNPLHIMTDDVLAGILTNFFLQIFIRVV